MKTMLLLLVMIMSMMMTIAMMIIVILLMIMIIFRGKADKQYPKIAYQMLIGKKLRVELKMKIVQRRR